MTKYDTFLFDWDGTLTHTIPQWVSATRQVLGKHGHAPSDAYIAQHIAPNLTPGLKKYTSDVDAMIDEIVATEQIQNLHLSPMHFEAERTIERLMGENKKVAIVSTNFRRKIDMAIEHHQLFRSIGDKLVIVAFEDVINRKPHPEPIYTALERLGVSTAGALMVGDSYTDVGAAKSANIPIAIHHPSAHKEYFSQAYIDAFGANYVIDKLDQVRTL